MSKMVRKLEMEREVGKIDPVLTALLNEVKGIAEQLPEDTFNVPHKDDFEIRDDEEDDNSCKIIKQSIQLANELVNHAPKGTDPPPLYLLAYKRLGTSNLLLHTQNYLKGLENDQNAFIDYCKQEMKKLDQEIAQYTQWTKAIESRKSKGDGLGDMGRMKEITEEEKIAMLDIIKELREELQENLEELIEIHFGNNVDAAKELLSRLFKASNREDGNPFVNIEGESTAVVAKMKLFGIIEHHPSNNKKVRIVYPD